ncbi:hypothetical protein DN069_11645 [Streptacidiphilus pinicola]|uniref:Uncharacterized protein n=1 Tax=Streptacidiphilus pinicola TaxID=2219663 RepID=A0A2X0IJW7_9ACTN|nr:hypothetical protein [Streptacidiphilus pinicola]RAG85424.1 hypothetical protein DN069_11645 [Streptacidiphilus pinicola]
MFSYGNNAPEPRRMNTPPLQPPAQGISDERREAVAERMSRELLEGRSPQQRQLAGSIFQRLREGAEVEDIDHLIKDIHKTGVDDFRRRSRAGY